MLFIRSNTKSRWWWCCLLQLWPTLFQRISLSIPYSDSGRRITKWRHLSRGLLLGYELPNAATQQQPRKVWRFISLILNGVSFYWYHLSRWDSRYLTLASFLSIESERGDGRNMFGEFIMLNQRELLWKTRAYWNMLKAFRLTLFKI